jgi:hypothetical protein
VTGQFPNGRLCPAAAGTTEGGSDEPGAHPLSRNRTLGAIEDAHNRALDLLADPLVRPLDAIVWSSAHLSAVQHVVHPAVARVLQNRSEVTQARQGAVAIEHALRQVEQLYSGDALAVGLNGPRTSASLVTLVTEQAAQEHALLRRLAAQLTAEEQERIVVAYEHALERAPNRPHPHAPHGAPLTALAYYLNARRDRVMDALDSSRCRPRTRRGSRRGPPAGASTSPVASPPAPTTATPGARAPMRRPHGHAGRRRCAATESRLRNVATVRASRGSQRCRRRRPMTDSSPWRQEMVAAGSGRTTPIVVIRFDGSASSEHAMAYAAGVSRRTGGSLLVAYVVAISPAVGLASLGTGAVSAWPVDDGVWMRRLAEEVLHGTDPLAVHHRLWRGGRRPGAARP